MGKKKEVEPVVENVETEVEDEYYLADEPEEEVKETESKNDKKTQIELLKAENEAQKLANEAKKLELEERKLNIDQEKANADRELELKRIDNEKEIEEKKVKVEEAKAENEKKAAKRDLIAKWGVAGIGLIGTGLSIYFSRKAFLESMYFEETGTFRTAVSKQAQAGITNTVKKLENVKKDL